MPDKKHTPGPWIMKPGDPELREGWTVEAPDSPHPFGPKYTRDDNVVGSCCSAGVYREEDARLICAAPDLLEACEFVKRWMLGGQPGPHSDSQVLELVEKAIKKATVAQEG